MSTNGTAVTTGKLLEIKGVVVDAVFPDQLPAIYSALRITRPDGSDLIAEVQQHLGDDRVRAVAMDATDGIARGTDVVDTGGADLGARRRRDARPRLERARRAGRREGRPARRTRSAGRSTATRPRSSDLTPKVEIFETGIKVIDLIAPVRARRQDRPLRRRRRRQDRADPGADPQHRARARRRLGLLRASASARARATTCCSRWTESGVLDKVALCYGQMNEPPGARLRVGLSGLTMAEYFRDQGQDVLLFIDNIFRFVQAGSEVSALLGRMPSAVGYQPTLATEMGQLQERITSTTKGAVTSVQAIYVPADDLTDPAPAQTLRAPRRDDHALARDRRAGHLPGRRPARLDVARAAAAASSRTSTTRPRRACRRCCSATRTCRTSSRSSASRSSRTRTA